MELKDGLYVFAKGNDTLLSPHFKASELDCKCSEEHDNFIAKYFLIILENYREILNMEAKNLNAFMDPTKEISISPNSGYRCIPHNKAVGGEDNGEHTKGTAADIRIINFKGLRYDKAAFLAYRAGFKGIGIYKNRIHVDVRDWKQHGMGFALWPYTEGLP